MIGVWQAAPARTIHNSAAPVLACTAGLPLLRGGPSFWKYHYICAASPKCAYNLGCPLVDRSHPNQRMVLATSEYPHRHSRSTCHTERYSIIKVHESKKSWKRKSKIKNPSTYKDIWRPNVNPKMKNFFKNFFHALKGYTEDLRGVNGRQTTILGFV